MLISIWTGKLVYVQAKMLLHKLQEIAKKIEISLKVSPMLNSVWGFENYVCGTEFGIVTSSIRLHRNQKKIAAESTSSDSVAAAKPTVNIWRSTMPRTVEDLGLT